MSEPIAVSPVLKVVAHSVTVSAGTLLLSQAVAAPVRVDNVRLVVSWQAVGPVRIQVTGARAAGAGLLPFNARHRDLEDLESTNPGLGAQLRSVVPHAPWERGAGV